MLRRTAQRGDVVVYRKAKHSRRPGPRAKQVMAAPAGDDYQYYVDKFWVVSDVRDDQTLLLVTRQGKTHLVAHDDPNLRHPTWWDRFWHGAQFPSLGEGS